MPVPGPSAFLGSVPSCHGTGDAPSSMRSNISSGHSGRTRTRDRRRPTARRSARRSARLTRPSSNDFIPTARATRVPDAASRVAGATPPLTLRHATRHGYAAAPLTLARFERSWASYGSDAGASLPGGERTPKGHPCPQRTAWRPCRWTSTPLPFDRSTPCASRRTGNNRRRSQGPHPFRFGYRAHPPGLGRSVNNRR